MPASGHPGIALRICLAAILASCAVTSPAASGTVAPSATTSPPTTGTPSATPSTDGSFIPSEPAALLFRLTRGNDVEPPYPVVSLYADGRLLTFDHWTGRLVQRVLTPAGREAILGEVVATGLFAEDHEFLIEVIPGAEVPGMGLSFDRFWLETDDGPIRVSSLPFFDPAWMLPAPERLALNVLADRLTSLAWLADDAWVDPNPVQFRGSAFLLVSSLDFSPPPAPGSMVDVESVAWPLPLGAHGFGNPIAPPSGDVGQTYGCVILLRGLAEEFRAAIIAAGMPSDGIGPLDAVLLVVDLYWGQVSSALQLRMRFLYPEEALSCEGKDLPPVLDP